MRRSLPIRKSIHLTFGACVGSFDPGAGTQAWLGMGPPAVASEQNGKSVGQAENGVERIDAEIRRERCGWAIGL